MIRILNAEPCLYSKEAKIILQSIGCVNEFELTRSQLMQCIMEYDVLIVRLGFHIDREVLDQAQHLKVVVSATTGLDHIDLAAAEAKGIKILSLRGQQEFLRSVPATAEHTWALLLSLVRNIPSAYQSVLDGKWKRELFRGHDLYNMQLGLIGLGRIGEKVARYGQAFGMQISAYDPFRKDWPANVVRCNSLPELLQRTNILSIHVPLNDSTHNLIGQKEFKFLPTGAFLVNTSRGGVLNEDALVAALESGILQGAALDVITGEQSIIDITNHPLVRYARSNSNLIITPHIGGATYESMAMTEVYMANKLCQFFQHKEFIS